MTNNVVLQIDGISCMDCAYKFEKEVQNLPGVTQASLNPVTGRLTIAGVFDLAVIGRLAAVENYTVGLLADDKGQKLPRKSIAGEVWRAIVAGLFIVAGFILEKTHSGGGAFIVLYVAAVLCGGWDNIRKALKSLTYGKFNMSVLMSIAVIGAIAIGEYEEAATVAFLFSLSELLEKRTLNKSRQSLQELVQKAPKTAVVVRNGMESEVAVEDVVIGDILVVRPGENIAMDGKVSKGESAVNQAAITGESLPAEKQPGDEVYAGTLNTYGALEIEVTKLVADTTIAKIVHLVEEAQGSRANWQTVVDRFAAIYTPSVMILAAGIVLIPPLIFAAAWEPWIYRGLALLVVACPCALVVSTPLAIISSISNAASHGILIKGGRFLEAAGSLAAIAFDKTGTLTQGRPVVTDIVAWGQWDEEYILSHAAALETRSEHILGAAIVEAAQRRKLSIPAVAGFAAITGAGATGNVDGKNYLLGNLRLFTKQGIDTSLATQETKQLFSQGKTVIFIGSQDGIIGAIGLADQVRQQARDIVAELKKAGISYTMMLTGDNKAVAASIAQQTGVDGFSAELLPEDKVSAIQTLSAQHGLTAMVGDGINDAPAMASAALGIAMGGAGNDTALETADIVLMADDLTKLPYLLYLSKKTIAVIRQNIAFALVIKLVAVLAVFPGWLTLWLAILADMGATIIVSLNSMRLLKIK